MADNVSRRDILRGSAAALVGLAAVNIPAETPTQRDKNARLRVGIIGAGGKGWSGMAEAAELADIVAICDVDAEYRSKASMEHPRAATFDDYRQMYAQMRGKMDAVVISTPDHHHAIASALAMRQGLHCYCEKPLTRTIWEARQLGILAKKMKVATQMGNQSTSYTAMRKAAALIKRGDFGHVKEIHLWTNRAAAYWVQGIERPKPSTAPKKLDFETWLGPRPDREFAEGYHPFSWRGWWDFGTGALGDMGCHILNMSHMALDLSSPIAVQAETNGHNRDSFPTWAIVHYEYAARKNQPAFKLHWYDGGKRPDADLGGPFPIGANGVIVVCENDTIFGLDEGNNKFQLTSGNKMPEIDVVESPGHMAEFIRAATGGPPAVSNFPDYSGPLTEAVLLGNLAIWANGPRLEWDAKRMKVKGTSEFDSLIKPDFKKGWDLV